ncbi:unnamed protein product [Acanthoscelides obtectus]|uniref:Uncharacterized protein n=1 Tax=Acanthoscelides obtectus TaxID=200917 RepID=A0A9P0PEK4_ACAOB|nr:unnamed protein product [Acanthoscelides obtectus]CAK1675846.1 Pro-resilin [Acanthoscelides obtectus]
MYPVCLLVLAFVCGSRAANIDDLPPNFPRCHRNDPELNKCILRATETVRPYILEGVPNFSKSVVNFSIPAVVLQDGNQAINYRADVTDMTMYGLENYKFEYFNFNPKNLTYTSKLAFPYIYIEGNYHLQGNIFFAPLKGQGAFHVNVSRTSVSTIQTNKKVMKNGKEYLEPVVSAPKLAIGEIVDYKFDGLFLDNVEIAKVANYVLDQNMGLIVQELLPTINKIFVACVISFITCGVPEVYEEVVEHPVNIRTVRNPKELHDKPFYQPPVFDYRMAKQQDLLRAKYAQQQMVDIARYYRNSRSNKPEKKASWSENDEDWKPFTPKVRRVRERGSKEYHANHTTVGKGEGKASSEDRKDSYIANAEILYLHPDMFRNAQGVQVNELNDLIGKNPNVQLEGLKRLLQMNGQQRHVVSTVKQPRHFQQPQGHESPQHSQKPAQFPQQDAEPQQHHEELPASLSDEDVKNGALEKLQNRLNEAAKQQAEQMLLQAQQQAQAQVEAQYKAIEAQREAMLEKARNTIQQSTVAPPASKNNVVSQEYQSTPIPHHDVMLVPQPSPAPVKPIVPLQGYYTTSDPEQEYILVPQSSPAPVEENEQDTYSTPAPRRGIPHQHVEKQGQVIWVTQTPSPFMVPSTSDPVVVSSSNPNHHEALPTPAAIIQIPETYDEPNVRKSPMTLKNILYEREHAKHYAPDHQHLVIEQAKKALISQIKDQNRAILNKKRILNARKPVHAYQEVALEPQEAENVQKVYGYGDDDDGSYREGGDEQYASKYAFGYRIRDNKEGNDFGHEERRNGKTLEGSYDVLLPDGRRQKVSYYADNSGFHAKVTYESTGHQ